MFHILCFDVETLSGSHHKLELACPSTVSPQIELINSHLPDGTIPTAVPTPTNAQQGGDDTILTPTEGIDMGLKSQESTYMSVIENHHTTQSDDSYSSSDKIFSLSNLRRRIQQVDYESKLSLPATRVETSINHHEIEPETQRLLDENIILLNRDNQELDEIQLNRLCQEAKDAAATSDGGSQLPTVFLRYRMRRYPVYADIFRILSLYSGTSVASRKYLIWFVDVLVVGIAALFLAACAQASFNLPTSWSNDLGLKAQVPITFQTFAILLTAALLGGWRAFFSSLSYILMITAGAPFGAGHSGNYKSMYGGSGGYFWSYPFCSLLVGRLAERGWDRNFRWCALAMTLGNLLIYVPALIWMPFGSSIQSKSGATPGQIFCGPPHGCVGNVFFAGLVPFIPGDAIKIAMACALVPIGWKIMPWIAKKMQEQQQRK